MDVCALMHVHTIFLHAQNLLLNLKNYTAYESMWKKEKHVSELSRARMKKKKVLRE